MANRLRQKIIDRVATRIANGAIPKSVTYWMPRDEKTLDALNVGLWAGVAFLAIQIAPGDAAGAFGVKDDRNFAEANAPLTTGESALVRGVFGPDFVTDNIIKYFHRELPPHQRPQRKEKSAIAYVLSGNTNDIHFIREDSHARDYSRAPDQGYRLHTFMHEMTHIWQHRHKKTADCDIYDFTLTADSRFSDFCNEQQAGIIADYSVLFLQPDSTAGQQITSRPQVLSEPYARDLIRVVEEQFPHARTSRLTMTAHFNAATACVVVQAHAALDIKHGYSFNLEQAWRDCAQRHVTTLNGQYLRAEALAPVLPATPPEPTVMAKARLLWANALL